MRLVRSARECMQPSVVVSYDERAYFGSFVHLVRSLWPKQRSVVGMTVSGMRPAASVTISAGNLYEALCGYEVET